MATTVEEQQVQKRVINACRYCKKRKVKCSGSQPCVTCSRRSIPCIFEEVEKKVLVPEKYLRQLERRYNETAQNSDLDQISMVSPYPQTIVNDRLQDPQSHDQEVPYVPDSVATRPPSPQSSESITNPLVSQTSTYVLDPIGRYRFLGPSSTWTFSQRAFITLQEALPENRLVEIPVNVDGSAYQLEYTCLGSSAPLDTSDLPSIDYTLYLMNAVKFNTCQMFRPFDEAEFTHNLYEFHQQGLAKLQSSRLWFVQFLLIVALGKAMVVVVRDPQTAPGSLWFQRAMSILPDFIGLLREPTLAIQVLCLVSLYLVSVDMKEAAYGYIGQAVRICMIEGLHRETPRQVRGDKLANHHCDIWWTVYILDRRLASMIGAPSMIQDGDITCPLPSADDRSQRGAVLNINVKISRLMAKILSSVYSVEHLSRPFVKNVQTALRDMAAMAHEMDSIFASAAYGSIGSISTVAGHITLSYHQCIMLATRPLLLHLLNARLKGIFGSQGVEKTLRPQTKDLLETCLRSARVALKVLHTLYEHHLVDSFLPFDLESVFSSAFIIIMASATVPSMVKDAAIHKNTSFCILDYLIRKGSRPAILRKKELLCLEQMIKPLFANARLQPAEAVENMDQATTFVALDDRFSGGWIAGAGESGVSPSKMLNIADQLEPQAQSSNSENLVQDWASTSSWTWLYELQNEGDHEMF